MNKKQKNLLARIIFSAAVLLTVNFAPLSKLICVAGYAAAYLAVGAEVLKKAFKGILNRRMFDENFLMATATLGAVALGIYEKSGDFNEAALVMLFYQTGELFQSLAIKKSRKNIYALMDLRPDYANIEKDGSLKQVDPNEVKKGDIIVVLPGEKIPLDGVVQEGKSTVDAKSLTGESVPQNISPGDDAISGGVNLSGVLKIQTTAEFKNSTVSKIMALIESSGAKKSKSENFISKFSRYYTPAVCALAVLLAFVPPICAIFAKTEPKFNIWIYRALSFLVVSCPCALVISIPLTFFAGLGGAGREGILIKGSSFVEVLSKVKTVVFDKTGTLTKGVFKVSSIHHSIFGGEKLLEYAAYAEYASSHPISKSLKEAFAKSIDTKRVKDIKEISGEGVTATVDGIAVAAGGERLMKRLGIDFIRCHKPAATVHIATDGRYAGHIVISDEIKPESKNAVARLKKTGVKNIVMLTGDSQKIADGVSKELEIPKAFGGLLPQDKVFEVERLLKEQKKGEKLAFAGDGINDAPVLSRADVGIAMGAIGSDAAVEAADVVLTDDNPEKIATAIRISKKCIRIVYENIIFSLGIKFLCLILTAFGFADMRAAVFADVGVMVIAVLNATRALHIKKL